MTRDELLDVLPTLSILDPASAHQLAEAVLLDFLLSEGYDDVVKAYADLIEEAYQP
jgi:hypothetical protein